MGKIKELQFQNDDDRKNQDRMSDLASKLQGKIKTYKKHRGGRGDRRPQPGQVPQGSAGAGGERGPRQDGRGQTCRWILLNIRTQEMIFDGDLATELDSGTAYLEYHRMLDAHPFNFVLLLLFSTSCMKNYLVSIQNI